jgi:hypothetical protein
MPLDLDPAKTESSRTNSSLRGSSLKNIETSEPMENRIP